MTHVIVGAVLGAFVGLLLFYVVPIVGISLALFVVICALIGASVGAFMGDL